MLCEVCRGFSRIRDRRSHHWLVILGRFLGYDCALLPAHRFLGIVHSGAQQCSLEVLGKNHSVWVWRLETFLTHTIHFPPHSKCPAPALVTRAARLWQRESDIVNIVAT